MVIFLPDADYDTWLASTVEEAPRFFRQYHGPREPMAAPLPPRALHSNSVHLQAASAFRELLRSPALLPARTGLRRNRDATPVQKPQTACARCRSHHSVLRP